MGLLAHAISRKAAVGYDSLVVDRICRPLHMDSTFISVPSGLKARLAIGHRNANRTDPDYDFGVMDGAGALRSTANDLLKYVSANLGLSASALTPLMQRAQAIRTADEQNNRNAAMD